MHTKYFYTDKTETNFLCTKVNRVGIDQVGIDRVGIVRGLELTVSYTKSVANLHNRRILSTNSTHTKNCKYKKSNECLFDDLKSMYKIRLNY